MALWACKSRMLSSLLLLTILVPNIQEKKRYADLPGILSRNAFKVGMPLLLLLLCISRSAWCVHTAPTSCTQPATALLTNAAPTDANGERFLSRRELPSDGCTHSVRHIFPSCLIRILHIRYTRMKNATTCTVSVDHAKNLCGGVNQETSEEKQQRVGARRYIFMAFALYPPADGKNNTRYLVSINSTV